jgi:short-subunit dehydrogenase
MKKYALITGATGGIGQAIAKRLNDKGYTLILHGRNEAKLNNAVKMLNLQSADKRHHALIADLSLASERATIVEKAFAIGPVELFINNAGISNFGNFEETSGEHISQMLVTNLEAPIVLAKEFLQKITQSKQGGTLINIGSALGSIGFPGFSLYCATKFGIRGFSQSLAREYAGSNIRVAHFAPRTTQTDLNTDQVLQMNSSMGSKVDSPEQVADAFMKFLYSTKRHVVLGWPEKLFARINGALPELVDNAFVQKLKKIKQFTQPKLDELK